ncbi:MAG TPA: Mu transposase C-terminal domain-containing protein, partial [Ktedonobacteraceae bacterium]|nr:Mu transposase C-terminal domain-containing protein [Ktedonobacteraceae bacterium]
MGLGIILHPGFPHDPEARGVIERFFETLNTRLLAKLPGYTGSNPTERNPTAKAELTLAQLAAEIEAFLVTYNHEEHTETGQAPWAYWEEHYVEDPPDERLLDMLLKEPDDRVVVKECIKYEGRVYWDAAFAELVNEVVEVRAAPSYSAPDEIEVFFEKRHICTAKAIDSPAGKAVTPQHIAQAQHHQRTWARGRIRQGRDTLQAVDHQLAKQGHKLSVLQTAPTPSGSSSAAETPAPSRPAQPVQVLEEEDHDLWDDLLEQEGEEEQ